MSADQIDDNEALNRFIGLGSAIGASEHEAFAPEPFPRVGPSWLKTLTEQRDAAKLEAETWSARATEAEAEVRRLIGVIEGLEKRAADQQQTLHNNAKAMTVWHEKHHAIEAENKRLTEMVHQLNTRITQRGEDVEALVVERDALREEHMKRADELTQNLKACRVQLEDMARALNDAQTQRHFLEERVKELSKDADKATQERDRALEQACGYMEQLENADPSELEQRVHDLEMEAIEHSDDVTALVRALARAEDEIAVLRRTRVGGPTS